MDIRRPPALNLGRRNEDDSFHEEDSESMETRRMGRLPARKLNSEYDNKYTDEDEPEPPLRRRQAGRHDDSIDHGRKDQRKGRKVVNESYDDDYDVQPPLRRDAPHRNDSIDDVDYDDHDYDRRSQPAAHKRGPKDVDWVPKSDFDELSNLCGKLLRQQQDLEDELQQKESMLRVCSRMISHPNIMRFT